MRLEPLVRARWRLVSLILRNVSHVLPLYGSRAIHAQRNPHVLSIEVFLALAERGRCGQTWTNVVVQAVMSQSWCVLARPSVAASTNPPTGVGLGSLRVEFAERAPAQGVFAWRHAEPGTTVPGIRVKRPMANSSTVKGPRRPSRRARACRSMIWETTAEMVAHGR